ncbi:MAG: aconitase X catalytic domain-containing protein [Pseudomonadota bacterium]
MIELTDRQRAAANGEDGEGSALAMQIVVETARLLGARRLIPIASAHIDGCLYHGDSGVQFAERLVAGGAKVAVPTTLNVGALNLLRPGQDRLDGHKRAMAQRLMAAYEAMGCRPSWTCAPYQTGHRPALGQDVAWGESNAVAFTNSVLGARTNRYGDFLDIACAITGLAPATGLHLPENRRATVRIDTAQLSDRLVASDALYPVLGAWLGRLVGETVAVIEGLPSTLTEDRLKALGASAAAAGAVGLVHVAGVTPEAPTVEAALGHQPAEETIRPTADMLIAERDRLSTADGDRIDAVALGSPHFSLSEFEDFEQMLGDRYVAVPTYICTARDTLASLGPRATRLEGQGVTMVVDTCVVVTPILAEIDGVLMTNSGKFAHYTPSNTGYAVLFGSLADCIESAVAGRAVRDDALWR